MHRRSKEAHLSRLAAQNDSAPAQAPRAALSLSWFNSLHADFLSLQILALRISNFSRCRDLLQTPHKRVGLNLFKTFAFGLKESPGEINHAGEADAPIRPECSGSAKRCIQQRKRISEQKTRRPQSCNRN
jgi:hypothetical protein